jgi:hypothetical protein
MGKRIRGQIGPIRKKSKISGNFFTTKILLDAAVNKKMNPYKTRMGAKFASGSHSTF